MRSAPEVTVVIPTRDRWRLLSTGALSSALAQEDVDHEVIVVDDGSTDGTPTRLMEIDNPRLVVLRHDRPLGVSAVRNAGVAAARGSWVSFLDDDDLWSPNKLRAQLDIAQAAEASFVYSGAIVIDERGAAYEPPTPEPEELRAGLLVRSSIPGGCSNVMVKTELVRRVGGFDTQLSVAQDWDLWLRLVAVGRVARCPEVLVACTAHGENTYVRTPWRDISRSLKYLVDKHRASGLQFDAGRFSRWVALERSQRGKRVTPALLLLWTAVRYRRPRYGLQALGILVRRRRGPTSNDHDAVQEPLWLRRYRNTNGWPP
jgi:glycosyltransferase involved in cell wall biosynthesis